jgi:hypothetical protein
MMVSRILERAGEEVTEELLDGRAAGRRSDEGTSSDEPRVGEEVMKDFFL